MANPTTNYGFVLPTSTDLVTDLPADFDVALQGVDTRLKALQPGTTLGDLAYSSATANTNTRLGIGSTGQVLTVAGGVPSWATLTDITGFTLLQTITANNTVTAYTTNTIPGTYKHILITGIGLQEGGSNDGSFSIRLNGDSGSNYTRYRHTVSGTTWGENVGFTTQMEINGVMAQSGQGVDAFGQVQIWLYDYAQTATNKPMFAYGSSFNASANKKCWSNGVWKNTAAVTSITLTDTNSANFLAGTFRVYGVS
jgi:hypothetical protein